MLTIMLFDVVCLWETILCVRDMCAVVLQYESAVPLLVSNIHDIILVHMHYYSVHTGMYLSVILYISCTCLYSVRTCTYCF